MSDNWVVQNLETALALWNSKLSEIWTLLLLGPQDFRGGGIWSAILEIFGALQAVGYGLLVLCFFCGVMKTCGSLAELKRPEIAVKMFVRFILAKALIDHAMDLLLALLDFTQGISSAIFQRVQLGPSQSLLLPQTMVQAIEECSFFESIPLWAVTLLLSLVVWILSYMIILMVYGRFFRLFMHAAIAPLPLATFAGEPTQRMGIGFLKSYAAVCLEGAVILLSCIIFTLFAATAPVLDTSATTISMVWKYIGELIFNMLILVCGVRIADRLVHEMLGI